MHDRTPPKPASINRWLDPIAECVEGGLHWHREWVTLGYAYGVKLRSWEFTAGAEREDPLPPAVEPQDSAPSRRKGQAFVRGGVQRQEQ